MNRATFEQLDKVAAKIGVALGKNVEIDRGGGSTSTCLRIDGFKVSGCGGTKQECYDACFVFLEGIEQTIRAASEGKASFVRDGFVLAPRQNA